MMSGANKTWKIIIFARSESELVTLEKKLEPIVDGIIIDTRPQKEGYQITGFCLNEPEERDLNSCILEDTVSQRVTLPKYEVRQIFDADWEEEYKEQTKPITVGRFFIYPDHFCGVPPVKKVPVAISAGLAFGTGEHQTTSGCLMAIDKIVEKGKALETVMDVGCGSAILAIAVSKLVPKASILALDNDFMAVSTAKKNIQKNNCKDTITVVESDFYLASEIALFRPFDLIVANILADPLIEKAYETASQLKLNGRLILSGLLRKQSKDVINAYNKAGLIMVDTLELDGWMTLTFKHRQCIDKNPNRDFLC